MTRLLSLLSASALACIAVARADDACATASCLANGDTPCDRSTSTCPPCMYTISGGYSCYGKVGSACPYPDTLTICADPAPTVVTSTPTASTSTTTTPRSTTAAPKTTTTSPVTSDTSSSSGSSAHSSSGSAKSTPSSSTSSPTSSTSSSSASNVPSSNSAKPNVTQSSVGTVIPSNGTVASSDRQDALTADTKSASTSSPGYVNIAIIVGASFGVLIVVAFIVRRVRQRRELPMQDTDFKTPHLGGPKDFEQGPYSTRHQNRSQYTHTQPFTDRVDFSMLESQNPPIARTKSARPSIASSMASSDLASSPPKFAVGTGGGSNLPQSYPEDRFNQYQPVSRPRAKSRVRGVETSLIQNQFPELVGSYNSDVSSVVSSQSEDFDIVDPGAIRPGERRNTETLVADGRFRQFSTISLAESYISDATTEGSEYGSGVYI